MADPYASYPALERTSQETNSPHMSDDSPPGRSGPLATNGTKNRRHAACDECRKRKLKCSGEPVGCERCLKQNIPCIYSEQKQMGRPRKKQKTDDAPSQDQLPRQASREYTYPDPSSIQPTTQPPPQPETPIDPSLAAVDQEMTSFQNVCSGPVAQTIRNQRQTTQPRETPACANMFEQGQDTSEPGSRFVQYPTDISQWPDFSTIDHLPVPLTSKYRADPALDQSFPTPSSMAMSSSDPANPYYDIDADPSTLSHLPATPSCPCLPNLYLALSTISTLSSFPVSQQTLDTLLSAHKTCHSVIYCPVCPQEYQSGSQNLMLGCTLLNVISDHWHRIRRAAVDDLKRGFSTPARQPDHPNGSANFISTREGQTWRHFARQVIRAYVFGDAPIPKPPTSPPSAASASSSSPSPHTPDSNGHPAAPKLPAEHTLVWLIAALERRQRQWHRLDPPTDEFPDRWATEYPTANRHRNGHGLGREKTIVEAAGKVRDPDEPRPPGRDDDEETLLCLMIVRHSRDIVAVLDEEK